ncbi:hypothetical protein IOD16_37095 [Saccharothrix sp. 6-C]|uniref:hypothetical protein n=1 Tax=Saccharothrix sp. 6-C TaxID=2781735 RepID=UPI001917145D|nr:hypothetical protein [Saccharothrix sp. 6-C]QQQ76550.1 hypothetical protein IOD16_37095 [Saccharothrix sp. 6-C]
MNLEEELGRLLNDDRLDVRARPDATEVVVTGARRVRRRRTAVVGAVTAVALVASGWGVTALGGSLSLPSVDPAVLPTTTTTTTSTGGVTAAPPPHTVVETVTVSVTKEQARPNVGYGAVKFGMTEQEVTATGLVTRAPGGECAAFTWTSDPGIANAVLVARGRGVVRIELPATGTTSKGIGVGSTLERVKAEYPTGQQAYGGGSYDVVMPGDVAWKYVFALDAERVVGIRMQRLGADCAQQGEQR